MKRDDRYRLVRATYSGEYWDRIVALRLDVYVEEQKVPIEEELDAWDETAVHFAALDGDEVVGTIRVVYDDKGAKLGRLAVHASHRRRRLARQLMQAALDDARGRDCRYMYLDAQTWVTSLYGSFGFVREGEVFMDCAIPHIRMVLSI